MKTKKEALRLATGLMNHSMAYGFVIAMEGLTKNPSMASNGAKVFQRMVTEFDVPLAEAINLFRWAKKKGLFNHADIEGTDTDEHGEGLIWEALVDRAGDFFVEVKGDPCDRTLDFFCKTGRDSMPYSLDGVTFLSERNADPLQICAPANWSPERVFFDELGSIYGLGLLSEERFRDEHNRPPNRKEGRDLIIAAIVKPNGFWGYTPCPTRANRIHLSITGIRGE